MALDNTKNFAKVEVSTGYDASALSVDLTTGHGVKLPTAPFNAVWWNSSDYPDPSDDPNVEIVRVTLVSTDTLTITRAQEGTIASTKNTGGKTYKMIAGLTAKVINTDIVPYTGANADVNLGTYDISAENINANAVEGDEKAPAQTTGNWNLGSGWVYATSPARISKNANGTGTATPTAVTNIVIGTTYKVTLVVDGYATAITTVTLGGRTIFTINADGTYTGYFTATTTSKILFSPSNTARMNATVSIIPLTDATGDANVYGDFRAYSTSTFTDAVVNDTLGFRSGDKTNFFSYFKAGTQGGNITYTLPAALPTSGVKFLYTSTTGAMSWTQVDYSYLSGTPWSVSGSTVWTNNYVGIGGSTSTNGIQFRINGVNSTDVFSPLGIYGVANIETTIPADRNRIFLGNLSTGAGESQSSELYWYGLSQDGYATGVSLWRMGNDSGLNATHDHYLYDIVNANYGWLIDGTSFLTNKAFQAPTINGTTSVTSPTFVVGSAGSWSLSIVEPATGWRFPTIDISNGYPMRIVASSNVFAEFSVGRITGHSAFDADFDLNDVINTHTGIGDNTGDYYHGGMFICKETTTPTLGLFYVIGTTVTLWVANALFSTTKDNAGTYNVYVENDGYHNNIMIQNKVGNNKNMNGQFFGA